MQQAQTGVQNIAQDGQRRSPRIVALFQLDLGRLHVPVSELAPQEILYLSPSLAVLIRIV